MAPWARNGSSVFTRSFATSVNVSEKSQKNLDESNHPINRTRSMRIMMQYSYESNGTLYTNMLTWDVQIVPWW